MTCLKRFLFHSGVGHIILWNNPHMKLFHWIRDHSKNSIDKVEAFFLFSPANSSPCHQATPCHVILHHIMSYYVMYQTCIQMLSSVKCLLISPFMEWRGAYVLGQICIELICQWGWGGGQKGLDPSWWSTFLEPLWGSKIFQASPKNGSCLDSQQNLNDHWVLKFWGISLSYLRYLTELLANRRHNLIIFPYIS